MTDRYRYDWPRIGVGAAALLMVPVTLAAGRWELAVVNAICAYLMLGSAWEKSYWSVLRCPFCRGRYPGHRGECDGSWWWEARWDG